MNNSINTGISVSNKMSTYTANNCNNSYQAPNTINTNNITKTETLLSNPATTTSNSETTKISSDTKKEKKGFFDGVKEAAATGAAIVTNVSNGTLKAAEKISDGLMNAGAKMTKAGAAGVASLVGIVSKEGKDGINNWAAGIEKSVQENIAIDVAGEINSLFYEDTTVGQKINELSSIKYDSKEAEKIREGTTKIETFAASTAAQVFTGPVGSIVLGFLFGSGEKAEKVYQQTMDATMAQEAGIFLSGIAEGLNWYAKGKMGEGLGKLAGLLKNGGGKVVLDGVKSTLSTLKSDGLKTTIGGIFKAGNIGTAIKHSGLESLRDSAGIIADDAADWLTGEKQLFDENGKIKVGEVGAVAGELAAAWALNVFTQSASDYLEGRLKVDVDSPKVSEKINSINEKYSSKNIISRNELAEGVAVNLTETNNKISDIYDVMKNKYGEEQTKNALMHYVKTGDVTGITRDANAREIAKFIPQDTVNNYLKNMEYLDEIKKTMEKQYGEKGLLNFDEFLKSGNPNYITRTDGMRDIAFDISEDMRKNYSKIMNTNPINQVLDDAGFKNDFKITDFGEKLPVTSNQYINQIDELCKEYPEQAEKLMALKNGLGNSEYVTDESIDKMATTLGDILRDDQGYFMRKNNNMRYKIQFAEGYSRFMKQADGSYSYIAYDVENFNKNSMESIVRYSCANNLSLAKDQDAIIKNIDDTINKFKNELLDSNLNNYYGNKKFIKSHTEYINQAYDSLFSTKYLDDTDKALLSSYKDKIKVITDDINNLAGKEKISIPDYDKLSDLYQKLLKIEDDLSEVSGKAWDSYFSNTDASFVHCFGGSIVGPDKFNTKKICTSLMSGNDGTIFSNAGIEFKPSMKDIDSISPQDAGSWDLHKFNFINECHDNRQFRPSGIWYEGGEHSKLFSPEFLEESILPNRNRNSYTEITLINNGKLKPSSFFVTEKATKDQMKSVFELAEKFGVKVNLIDTKTLAKRILDISEVDL